MIIIVFGLPGSGKSYFASRLATWLHARYINSDKVRMEMFPERTYSDEEKLAVYQRMLEQLKIADKAGKNVVLDATFYKDAIRKKFADASDKIVFIEVQAAESIIKERVKRPRRYSEADVAVYEAVRRQWEPFEGPHLILESADDNVDKMLAQATAYLEAVTHDARGDS